MASKISMIENMPHLISNESDMSTINERLLVKKNSEETTFQSEGVNFIDVEHRDTAHFVKKEKLLEQTSLSSKQGAFTNTGTYYVLSGPQSSQHTVLFIHGIGSFHQCFDCFVEPLEQDGYRVLRYDLIGRGRSAYHATGKFGAEQHIDQLLNLLEYLHIDEPVHVVGHSMGGAIAALFSSQYPSKVQSLTLLCPAGLMDGIKIFFGRLMCCFHGIIKRAMNNRETQEKAWRNDFYHNDGEFLILQDQMVQKMRAMYEENHETAFEALWQSILQFPLYGIQKDIRRLSTTEHLKVLIIWGDRDTSVPIRTNLGRWKRLFNKSQCKDVRFKVLKNAGHSFFFEYPIESTAELLNFLRSSCCYSEDSS